MFDIGKVACPTPQPSLRERSFTGFAVTSIMVPLCPLPPLVSRRSPVGLGGHSKGDQLRLIPKGWLGECRELLEGATGGLSCLLLLLRRGLGVTPVMAEHPRLARFSALQVLCVTLTKPQP